MLPYCKKVNKYFAKHPWENSAAHLLIGAGVGFLLTYPMAGAHPVRWGGVFLLAGLAIHLRAAK